MAVAEYLVANRKDAGMPGPQGPSGPAGVTSARGETLPPGSEVEVELHDRVLTVRVPRGDKGDKGETGATGAQGPKGATGAQGPRGDKGDKGDAGPQGERGPQGPKGDKGDGLRIDYTAASSGELPTSGVTEGQTGIVNGELFVWDGSQWSSQGQMQGAKGEPGPQGPKGDKGDTGAAGATPSITMSATVGNTVGTPSVQVSKGGTVAAPSFAFAFSNLKGETGAQGPQGVQGPKGERGPQGETGAQGPQGATGAQGPKGDKGDGLRIDYTAASSGELPTSGVTEGQTGIVNGELFVWDGSQWSSQGQMQGAKGEPGPQGPKGDKGDTGAAGATPSITMSATVGNTVGTPSVQVSKGGTVAAPSFAFAFSNLKGETGAQGPQGVQGPKGERGPQGETGAQGPQGATGAQGPKGADGEDAVVSTIPVTFEASLFKSGLSARKSVSCLGSVNMVSPKASASNIAACQACAPWLADHTDDSSIPAGQVQCTVSSVPPADLHFVVTVLKG